MYCVVYFSSADFWCTCCPGLWENRTDLCSSEPSKVCNFVPPCESISGLCMVFLSFSLFGATVRATTPHFMRRYRQLVHEKCKRRQQQLPPLDFSPVAPIRLGEASLVEPVSHLSRQHVLTAEQQHLPITCALHWQVGNDARTHLLGSHSSCKDTLTLEIMRIVCDVTAAT